MFFGGGLDRDDGGLDRDDGGLLPDAYLHLVRKKKAAN